MEHEDLGCVIICSNNAATAALEQRADFQADFETDSKESKNFATPPPQLALVEKKRKESGEKGPACDLWAVLGRHKTSFDEVQTASST